MLDSGPAAFSAKPANLLQVLAFISLTEVATWMLVQGPMRSAGRMGAVPTDFTQKGIGEECSHRVLGPQGGCESALHKDARFTHWPLRGLS